MTAPTKTKASSLGRYARLGVASIGLVALLTWLMHAGSLPLLPPAGTLERLNAGYTGLFVLAMLVSMLTKYARYRFLLAPVASVTLRRVMSISCTSMALITALPFRLGELAKPAMLRKKGKISGWAVTGTVAAERIIDGVGFGLTLLLGLALSPRNPAAPDHIGSLPVPTALVPRAAVLATAGFGVALLTMGVFYWRREFARSLTERVLGIVSPRLALRVADIVTNMSNGFGFLVNPKHTVPYVLVSAISIVAHVLAILWLAIAVGLPPLAFAQGAVLVGVLALGFALPNVPGFFGAVQLALYAGLALYVPPERVVREGALLVFVFYVVYLGLVAGLAAVAIVVDYAMPEKVPTPEPELSST